jgi:hypothetical protein
MLNTPPWHGLSLDLCNMKKLLATTSLIGVLAFTAQAIPTGLGTGQGVGNSWTFTFQNTTYGVSFDTIEMFITGGTATFDAAAGVGTAGWGGVLVNPTYTFISGPTIGADQTITLSFFDPAPAGGVRVDFLTWSGGINGTLLPGQWWAYTDIPSGGANGQYTFLSGTMPNYNRSVPDGGVTAMLLGMGMLGLGWVRRMVK